jgi:hypothetical protein
MRHYFIEQTFDWLRPIKRGLDQPSTESFLIAVQEKMLILSNINK